MLYGFIHRTDKSLLRLKDAVADSYHGDLVVVGSESDMRKFRKNVLDKIGGFEQYRLTVVSTRYGQNEDGTIAISK